MAGLPLEADDSTYYTGTVSRILHQSGFGFITCEESKLKYGDDVYMHSSQLEGLTEGDTVSFRVHSNKKGRPQAVDLVVGEVQFEDDSVAGTVALFESWLESLSNRGAQAVPEILESICNMTEDRPGVLAAVERWRRDNTSSQYVRTPSAATGEPIPPWKRSLAAKGSGRSTPYTTARNVGGNGMSAGAERFSGTVSAIIPAKNGKPPMGFVQCDETMSLYGDDVFLHSTQAEQLAVGQHIVFSVHLNPKGKPQATDVEIG